MHINKGQTTKVQYDLRCQSISLDYQENQTTQIQNQRCLISSGE